MAEMFNPLNPLNSEIMELSRQRKLADLLTSQGMQTPQAQNVSGIYVPPNPMEYLAKLYSTYQGTKVSKELDTKEQAMANALRQRYGDELKEFRNLMQGREELAPQQAGPTQTGQAIPQEMVRGAPNVQGAYDFAATAYNPALQAAGLRKLTEGPIKVSSTPTFIGPSVSFLNPAACSAGLYAVAAKS